MKMVFLAMSFVVIANICHAGPKIVTVKDPEAPDKVYTKILIDYGDSNYSTRKEVENSIRHFLELNSNLQFVLSHEVFLPTREYSEDQRKEIVGRLDIDAILIARRTEQNVSRISVMHPVTNVFQQYGNSIQNITKPAVRNITEPALLFSNTYDVYLIDNSLNKAVLYVSINSIFTGNKGMGKCIAKEIYKSGFINKKTNNFKTVKNK